MGFSITVIERNLPNCMSFLSMSGLTHWSDFFLKSLHIISLQFLCKIHIGIERTSRRGAFILWICFAPQFNALNIPQWILHRNCNEMLCNDFKKGLDQCVNHLKFVATKKKEKLYFVLPSAKKRWPPLTETNQVTCSSKEES